MSDHDKDWLDAQLSATPYVPDDGFTARVMTELPKSRPARSISARHWILLISTAASLILILALIKPLSQTVGATAALYLRGGAMQELLAMGHEPLVLFGAAAGLSAVVTLATIPFLRRSV